MLSGEVPGTDIRLGRKVDDEHVHRPGWDITLSAPKSVSLQALVAGDRRVIRAHDRAVRDTLDWDRAGTPRDPGLGPGDPEPAEDSGPWHGLRGGSAT